MKEMLSRDPQLSQYLYQLSRTGIHYQQGQRQGWPSSGITGWSKGQLPFIHMDSGLSRQLWLVVLLNEAFPRYLKDRCRHDD